MDAILQQIETFANVEIVDNITSESLNDEDYLLHSSFPS